LLYIAFSIWLAARFVVSQARAVAKADSALGAQLADSVTGNATVKSFAKEKHEDRLFDHIAKDWMRKLFNLYVRFNLISMAQNTLMTVIKISLFLLIIWLWSQGKATAGDFVFILGIYALLSGYLRHIGDQVREVQRAANDLEEMVEYSLTPLQVQDVAKAKKLKGLKGAVSLKNITFTYPNQPKPVFKNFSLEIKPGQRIALVGHSGSGKSTFVKLLQRFYDLDEGSIEIASEIDVGSTFTCCFPKSNQRNVSE
jgi:ATP-binding cassette subfamily B protein